MSRHGAMYQDIIPLTSRYYDQGKFGRLFPSLPAFAANTPKVREALKDMGKKGGLMDANDNLDLDPRELVTNEDLQINNPNNLAMSAGMTFLGQFMITTLHLTQLPVWSDKLIQSSLQISERLV